MFQKNIHSCCLVSVIVIKKNRRADIYYNDVYIFKMNNWLIKYQKIENHKIPKNKPYTLYMKRCGDRMLHDKSKELRLISNFIFLLMYFQSYDDGNIYLEYTATIWKIADSLISLQIPFEWMKKKFRNF